MTNLARFSQKYPRYQFSSQFYTSINDLDSVISFFNYYDSLFKVPDLGCQLISIFHNEDGAEVGTEISAVEPGMSVRVSARELGIQARGMVAVIAVPDQDIGSFKNISFDIKDRVTTGFYMDFYDGDRLVDTMHEWEPVDFISPRERVVYVGIKYNDRVSESGLVFTCPTMFDGDPGTILFKLKNELGICVGSAKIKGLESMTTCCVSYSELFDNFGRVLVESSILIVEVIGRLASDPLTYERHVSGDFHVHHI